MSACLAWLLKNAPSSLHFCFQCSVEETANGGVHVHLKPSMPGNRNPMLRENSIVVLTLSRPPGKGSLDWVQGGRGRGGRRSNGSPEGPHHKRQR